MRGQHLANCLLASPNTSALYRLLSWSPSLVCSFLALPGYRKKVQNTCVSDMAALTETGIDLAETKTGGFIALTFRAFLPFQDRLLLNSWRLIQTGDS